MYGYHGIILHVDLGNRTFCIEEPDEIFCRLYAGGGLLGAYYLLKETRPGIDPLSPDNLLIFSNSVIAGYPAAGLVRYIVTAKSPLTNGVGETRCEGIWTVSLKKSGFDAIIFMEQRKTPADK
jgi:aldehyde:ferredoxin oxidoreductase